MPGPSVSLFNTNSLPVQVTVNNGPNVAIQGASWPQLAPQTPASGNPNWDYGGPSPNTLGPGTNSLTVTPQGMMQPFVFQVGIPGSFQWQSVLTLFTGCILLCFSVSVQAPRKRPAARNTKKIEMLYVARAVAEPA